MYLTFRIKYSEIIVIKTENLRNTVIIGKDNAWVPPSPNIMFPEIKKKVSLNIFSIKYYLTVVPLYYYQSYSFAQEKLTIL